MTKVSDEAKDFILGCLEKDPRDRLAIGELLDHGFLSKIDNLTVADMY